MKGKAGLFFVSIAAAAVVFAPRATWATYTSISHNLVDGKSDTEFNASNGMLTCHSESTRLSLFEESGKLPGAATNVSVDISAQLAGYDPATRAAFFNNGTFSLTFDYGGSTGHPYGLSGPIDGLFLTVGATGPAASQINGEGIFKATDLKNLPGMNGAGDWPDGGDVSSIRTLTLDFGHDISGFAWNYSIGGDICRLETQYALFPGRVAAPEPASCLLLLVGSAFLARRRRA